MKPIKPIGQPKQLKWKRIPVAQATTREWLLYSNWGFENTMLVPDEPGKLFNDPDYEHLQNFFNENDPEIIL